MAVLDKDGEPNNPISLSRAMTKNETKVQPTKSFMTDADQMMSVMNEREESDSVISNSSSDHGLYRKESVIEPVDEE